MILLGESMRSVVRNDVLGAVSSVRRRNRAAGMVEAGKQFRRVNGPMHLRSLRDTLERITQPVDATDHTDAVSAA